MNYNFHIEKYKYGDIAGLHKEAYRTYSDEATYRNDVDMSRSEDNKYIDIVENGSSWFTHVLNLKRSTEKQTGKSLRKDAVCLCCTVESVPPTWPREAYETYFEDKANWFNQYLHNKGVDENSVLSVVVHEDENSPHAHMAFVPAIQDKLNCKAIMTRDFLRDVQNDGQQFCFDWIEKYNLEHGEKLEELEPIVNGSIKKHLSNVEFKKQKLEEEINTLQVEHQEITTKVEEAKSELEETRQTIVDEKQQLEEEKAIVREIQKDYESKSKELVELTQAPDVPKYQEVVQENKELKQELTLKDKVIESLQHTVESLKATVDEWKHKFESLTNKLGSKLMQVAGVTDIPSETAEYPTAEVSKAMNELLGEAKQYNVKDIRVLPDSEASNKYKIVYRNSDGKYQDIKNGFESREDAERWRDSLKHYKDELKLEESEENSLNRTLM